MSVDLRLIGNWRLVDSLVCGIRSSHADGFVYAFSLDGTYRWIRTNGEPSHDFRFRCIRIDGRNYLEVSSDDGPELWLYKIDGNYLTITTAEDQQNVPLEFFSSTDNRQSTGKYLRCD